MDTEIIGVYPVPDARQPCHLLEVILRAARGRADFGEFTQEDPDLPRESWQVAWEEYLLSAEGTPGEPAPSRGPVEVRGSQRAAFFIHFLDTTRAILGPGGAIELPDPTPRPRRLEFLRYVQPD